MGGRTLPNDVDVALLRLAKSLSFNQWVKPISLPTAQHVTFKGDRNWRFGPRLGTMCSAAGWGRVNESGQGSDNLLAVRVPITSCKPHDGLKLCAGYPKGGRSTCQGDSGGPLVCPSKSGASQIYLAGIVSHGKGCARANEPAKYTRVALFVDWILHVESKDVQVGQSRMTQTECPGFRCDLDGRCIPEEKRCDRQVDCLHGEDEAHCEIVPEVFLGEEIVPSLTPVASPEPVPPSMEVTVAPDADPALDQQPVTESANVNEEATNQASVPTSSVHTPVPDNEALDISNGNGTQPNDNRKANLLRTVVPQAVDHTMIGYSQPANRLGCKSRGYRCPSGNCVEFDKLCDGNVDCHDASDEKPEICQQQSQCGEDEMKCGNGLCIPRSKYCDGINDCEDFTDEPLRCPYNQFLK